MTNTDKKKKKGNGRVPSSAKKTSVTIEISKKDAGIDTKKIVDTNLKSEILTKVIKFAKDFLANQGAAFKAFVALATLATIIGTIVMISQCGQEDSSSVKFNSEQNTQNYYDLFNIDFNVHIEDIRNIFNKSESVTADTISELQSTAWLYIEQEDYKQAIKYLEKASAEQVIAFGTDHISTVSSRFLIGVAYYWLSEYDLAIENLNIALAATGRMAEKSEELEAGIYYVLGLSFDYLHDYENALIYYSKMLEIKRILLGNDALEIASILSFISITHLNLGEFDLAHKYLLEAKKIVEERPNSEFSLAGIYAILGQVCYFKGDYSYAIIYYEDSLKIFEKNKDLYQEQISTVKSNLGAVHFYLNEYDSALELYLEAKDISETLNDNELERSNLYNSIGLTYTYLENFEYAKLYFDKAIDIIISEVGIKDLRLATLYCNYAELLKKQGEYDEAIKYLEKDIKICEETLGANNLDIASSYYVLGSCYSEMENQTLALYYLQESAKIRERILGSDHLTTCTTYYDVGGVYSLLGNNFEALNYFKRAYQPNAITEDPDFGKRVLGSLISIYTGLGMDMDQFDNWLNSK